jgi:hypothetical protein
MAAGTVAPLNVIEKLALKIRCDLLTIDDCFQVRSFKPVGELGGLFVFGAAGEMRFVLGFGPRGFVLFRLIFLLVPFFLRSLLLRSSDIWSVEEVGDRSFHASEVRWVGARVYCSFYFIERVS